MLLGVAAQRGAKISAREFSSLMPCEQTTRGQRASFFREGAQGGKTLALCAQGECQAVGRPSLPLCQLIEEGSNFNYN